MMRKVVRVGAVVTGCAAVAAVARLAWEVQVSTGASRPRIRPYAAGSPNYRGGAFHNTEPSSPLPAREAPGVLRAVLKRGNTGTPSRPIPLAAPLAPTKAGVLASTWLGHSTVLVEVDGYRVLTDPVWSERCSPSQKVGPSRMHAVPIAISALPKLDAVVISHDHYDHLDEWSIRQLAARQNAPFVVPLGVGSHLRSWGVADDRIIELDWNRSTAVGELTVTCTPARHFSGRGLVRDSTLWASWVFAGPSKKVYFGGDTGYTARFKEIGQLFGPFDLSLLPVGAYAPQWPDIHMTPEEAVQAYLDLNGDAARDGMLIPIHWATFNLALHSWADPIVRLLDAAKNTDTYPLVPMPGQRVDVLKPQEPDGWWVSRG